MIRPRILVLALGLLAAGAAALAQPQAALPLTSRELVNALLWQQITVEYRASALSAYRLATSRLDAVKASGTTASMEQLAMGGYKNKKPAVVLDIDETVLDNMPYDALLIQQGRPWPDPDWEPWVMAAEAHAVPGVRGFVARARAKGFRVVFITDRDCRTEGGYDANGQALVCPQKEATLRNLTGALGYRPAAADLMLRGERQGRDDSDKQARRIELARTHRIALQVGDDLKDFIRTTDYDPDKHGAHWGTRWIILPNPVYGSWERPMRGDLAKKYAAMQPWLPPVVPPAARLKLLSWNLEWFADPQSLIAGDFWGQCAARNFPNEKLKDEWPFCDVYKKDGILNAADYEAKKLAPLRARLAELGNGSADVLAVQETQGPAALQAVLPAGWRVACFSTRVDAQNVGFAVRDAAGLNVACREISALSLEGQPGVTHPVRRGLELTVGLPNTLARNVVLLNVHLKSSCPTGRLDSTSNFNCVSLQQQVPLLEAWVEDQAARRQPFAIVGDWNRDLDAEVASGFPARSDNADPAGPLPDVKVVRNLWPEVNDGVPVASVMEIAAIDRAAGDGANACHRNLDQLVISQTLKSLLQRPPGPTVRHAGALLARPPGASDHCPLATELLLR